MCDDNTSSVHIAMHTLNLLSAVCSFISPARKCNATTKIVLSFVHWIDDGTNDSTWNACTCFYFVCVHFVVFRFFLFVFASVIEYVRAEAINIAWAFKENINFSSSSSLWFQQNRGKGCETFLFFKKKKIYRKTENKRIYPFFIFSAHSLPSIELHFERDEEATKLKTEENKSVKFILS